MNVTRISVCFINKQSHDIIRKPLFKKNTHPLNLLNKIIRGFFRV